MLYMNPLEMIGNTPIVKLFPSSLVYGKIESRNPFSSIKDRAAYYMLKGALERKEVKTGDSVVIATSGNTGIAVSAIAPLLGLSSVVVMPESMSDERKKLVKALGAELVLTPKEKGMAGANEEAERIRNEKPGHIIIDQFSNPDNVRAHYETTGPEILRDIGDVSFIVAGIGSGGTISGIGKYMKEHRPDVKMIGVEPEESPLITKGYAAGHKIQGIGANFIPSILDMSVISDVVRVKSDDAIACAKQLVQSGILAGISSGASVLAAVRIADENKGKKVLAILPDGLERYMSTSLVE